MLWDKERSSTDQLVAASRIVSLLLSRSLTCKKNRGPMKKYVAIVSLLCAPLLFSSQHAFGEETPATPSKESQAATLKEPFCRMTPSEQTSSGIQKLSAGEQDALIKWWSQHKTSSHQHNITKEVSIASIANESKNMVLSDGSKISFTSSMRKKVSRWVVGDKIGLGEAGKRGSVSIYHIASGQKVKAKREQAPKQESSSDKQK
jgi:hypothetical protein